MIELPVILDEQHAVALGRLARTEYRDMAQQAAAIIRDELIRRGVVKVSDLKPAKKTKLSDVHSLPARRSSARKMTN